MADLALVPLALLLVLFILVSLRLQFNKAAQPLRLELADRGEALLLEPDLPKTARPVVEHFLESAFSDRGTLIFGLFALPIVGVFIVAWPRRFLADIRSFSLENPVLYKRFREVSDLHDKITMANHPILWLLFELELLVVGYLAILILAGLRAQMPNRAVHDTVTGIIEQKRLKILGNQASVPA